VGNSPCTNATSQKTLTITAAPTAVAGANQSICSNSGAVSITGASATNQASVNWTSSGTGTFTNGTTLTPNYTPSAADISAGSVTLTLTAVGNSPCANAVSAKSLTIITAPTIISEPTDQTVCASFPVSLTVAATGAASYQWYKNGNPVSNGGTISGATSATLHFSQAATGDIGDYYVKVIGTCPCG
jgi:hypothetical protein